MKKFFFLLLILYLPDCNLSAQSSRCVHSETWSRATIAIRFHEIYSAETEVQFRSQSPALSPRDFPSEKLLFAVRCWLYRQPGKNLTTGFSPFAFFYGWPLLTGSNDAIKKNTKEYRTSLSAEWKYALGKGEIKNRYGYELRNIAAAGEQGKFSHRFRTRLAMNYPLQFREKNFFNTAFQLSGEFFIAAGKNVPLSGIFEQNRISSGFSFRPQSFLKIDLQLQHGFRPRKDASCADIENALLLYITFML